MVIEAVARLPLHSGTHNFEDFCHWRHSTDYELVFKAVARLALYSGMHALDESFHWRYSTEGGAGISHVGQWMMNFLTNNLEKSVLVKEDAPFSYYDLLRQTSDIPTIQQAPEETVPGRGNVIRLSETDFPGVTQAALDMMARCPTLVVTPESPQKSLGVKLDRRQYQAASAVIRLTGLRAIANASVSMDSDGLVKRLLELGVDNRPLAGTHLVEATPLENLKEWNCDYTATILGCSLARKSRIGLVLPHAQATSQQATCDTVKGEFVSPWCGLFEGLRMRSDSLYGTAEYLAPTVQPNSGRITFRRVR